VARTDPEPEAIVADEPSRVGVSACLLGHHVRYDGRDKAEPAVVDILAHALEFVPVCPEVELGMGVPRESIELVDIRSSIERTETAHGAATAATIRLLGVTSKRDHTLAMRAFAARRVRELEAIGICGYVFKSRSPSCGLRAVPIFDHQGRADGSGRGMFARALAAHFPGMPLIEETQVRDADQRASFLDQMRA